MPEPPADADAKAEPAFEDLLVDLLQAVERQGDTAIEALAAAHPGHAERLRTHARRLADLGFLATAQANPELAGLPERLGDYRPLHRIGGGGMGVVYAAEQTSLGRRVALKLIRTEQLFAKSARDRFAREVHAVAKLQHPGIVPVYDTGETAGLPWLAMELVQGAPLDRVLEALHDRAPETLTGADLEQVVLRLSGQEARGGSTARPPIFTGAWVAACLRLARAVADALVHAHDRGVLHRDVKPSNVMLTPDGRALLLDFGLAFSADSARLTQGQLGSPAYMAPEQVRGEDVDARADVWSLGVTLCELLTLRSPFAADNAEATRANVLAARPVRLQAHNPALPRDAELVCLAALTPERDGRYATMRAFAADLDNLLEHRPVQARPPTPLLVLRRWAQRRPAAAVAAVAAVLLLVVAPTAFWLQQRSANASIREALDEAQRQRDHARAATADARRQRDHARDAVQTLLLRVGAEHLDAMPHMQGLRRDLLTEARRFHERFLAEAGDEPELLQQAAESATELARVDLELGAAAAAREQAERAVTLARRLLAREGGTAEAMGILAQATSLFAGAAYQLGEHSAARDPIEEAVALQRCVVALVPDAEGAPGQLMQFLRIAATVHLALGEPDAALAEYDAVQALWREADTNGRTAASMRELAIGAGGDAAWLHYVRGDADAAADAAASVVAWCDDLDRGERSTIEQVALARACDVRARLAREGGDPAGAESAARRAVAEVDSVLADLPLHANAMSLRAAALNTLALVVEQQPGRRAESVALFGQSIAMLRDLLAIDENVLQARFSLATSLVNLGAVHQDDGDLELAHAVLREATVRADALLADAATSPQAGPLATNAWWFLGQVAGQRRDHAGQIEAADRLAAIAPDDARLQRIAGSLLAEACQLLRDDPAVPDAERPLRLAALQQRAVERLRTAAGLGCADHAHLATHAVFAAVRDVPDFAAIVERMRQNAAADAPQQR